MDRPDGTENRRLNARCVALAAAAMLGLPAGVAGMEWTAGPAVAVRYFSGSGPYAEMGKGLADMVVTDLVTLTDRDRGPYKDCNMAVVEWEKRAEIQKEIDLSQSPHADPSTRLEKNWVDPQYFVEGSVRSTENSMSWSLQLRDARSGRIVAKDDGTVSDNDMIAASEGIARRVVEKLCRQGKDYSGRPLGPPPPAPAAKPAPDKPASNPANGVMDALKGLKGLFGK